MHGRRRERAVLLARIPVVGGSGLAFGGLLSGSRATLATYVPFLLLVWAGCRLGPRGAFTAALAIWITAIVGTASGRGPFTVEGTHDGPLLLWAYGVAMGTIALTLAAAIAQRDAADSGHRAEEASRLRIEQKMAQAQRIEGLGLLAGGIAHDFNNILTVILGNARLLEDRLAGDPTVSDRLRKIEVASERAADLCERLLFYAGHHHPVMQRLILAFVAEETWAMIRWSISPTTTLETSVSADTPAIEGDPTLLQQVVMNLVLNAADAIGEQPGRIEIVVGRADLDARELAQMSGGGRAEPGCFGTLEVRDTGVGMDARTLERIFDPFFSTKFEGRGLGLASVLGIVQSHGGAIDVNSTPGRGSSFCVYLPAATSEASSAGMRDEPREIHGAGRLVLVAEDELDVRNVVVQVLESAGYRTLAVCDGREALESYDERRGDIAAVLLDVTMPNLGGVEALAGIRARDPHVPVVLMSGAEAHETDAGPEPSAIVRKPFSKRSLVEQLGWAIERRTRAQQPDVSSRQPEGRGES